MKTFEVEIQGVPPGLLMNKFGVEAQTQAENEVQPTKSEHGTPEEQAEPVAYRLANGTLCQPAEHVFQALCKAAVEFKVKGKGKKTYKDAVKGNVVVEPEYLSHQRADYEIDSRPVRIQRSRIVRHRPHLPEWMLSFTLTVLDKNAVPASVLNNIIVKAGQTVGIGDYRPRFGRFIVTSFKEAKNTNP